MMKYKNKSKKLQGASPYFAKVGNYMPKEKRDILSTHIKSCHFMLGF